MLWMHSKSFGTSQLETTLSNEPVVISLYMRVSAIAAPSLAPHLLPDNLIAFAPGWGQRSSGEHWADVWPLRSGPGRKASSWKLDLLYSRNLQQPIKTEFVSMSCSTGGSYQNTDFTGVPFLGLQHFSHRLLGIITGTLNLTPQTEYLSCECVCGPSVCFTCWYEVVYTMTFCCCPSAVIIPAGSGFAGRGEKNALHSLYLHAHYNFGIFVGTDIEAKIQVRCVNWQN